MYNGKKILALIPARGGSKGIKNKNIIELCGKPLISYTIDAAKGCNYIDDIVVSTDSEEIAKVARKYGAWVPFMRPAKYATDTSSTLDVVLHAVNKLKEEGNKYDVLVLLQPTEPLRDAVDIKGAIEKYFIEGAKDLVSVSKVDDHPLLMRTINKDGTLKKLLNLSSTCRRQDMPDYYRVNGCIYINGINNLKEETSFNDNNMPYIMSQEHSVDIDEPKDLVLAEYYLQRKEND